MKSGTNLLILEISIAGVDHVFALHHSEVAPHLALRSVGTVHSTLFSWDITLLDNVRRMVVGSNKSCNPNRWLFAGETCSKYCQSTPLEP